MNPLFIAQLINAGFSIISGLRRVGWTTEKINERLDRADEGGEAITVDEVRASLDEMQAAINEGRQL